jgi:uncharacterized protein (DUF2235 family)
MKRLAVFQDGTWNVPADNTNVLRLKDMTVDNGADQFVHYEEGVGNRFMERLRGGTFGKGLSRVVLDSYQLAGG